MTDAEKVKILTDAMQTLAIAEMGEPSLYAKTYEQQVREIARGVLVDISDVTPQD